MTVPVLAQAFGNCVKVFTTSTGTGSPITLSTAVPGFFGAGAAVGIADAIPIKYTIIGNAGALEMGWGVLGSAGTTLTRNVVKSSAGGTTPITLAGGEQVIVGDVHVADMTSEQPGTGAALRSLANKALDVVKLLDFYQVADGSDLGIAFNRTVAYLLSNPGTQLAGGVIDMNNLGLVTFTTQPLIDLNALVANIEVEMFGTAVKVASAISAFQVQRVNYVGPSVTFRGGIIDARNSSSMTTAFDLAGACCTQIEPSVMIIGDGTVASGWPAVRLRQYDQTDANTGSFSCNIWPRVWSDTNPSFIPVGVQVEGQCNGLNTTLARFENVVSGVRFVRPQGAGATHDLCNAALLNGMQVEHATYAVEVVDESGQANISGLQMKNGRYENCGYLLAYTGTGGTDGEFPPQVDGNFQTQDIGTVVCTASFSGTTMTVTDLTSTGLTGRVVKGQVLTGTGITAGTTVTAQLTGQTGGLGTYTVSNSLSLSSRTVNGQTTGWIYNPHGVQIGTLLTHSFGSASLQDYDFNQSGKKIAGADAAKPALEVDNFNGKLFRASITGSPAYDISGLTDSFWLTAESPNGAVLFDLQANGLHKTPGVKSRNLSGVSGALSAGTATVTFPNAEPNANYRVVCQPNAAVTAPWRVASKATTGFSIVTTDVTSTATFDWIKVQD